MRYLPPLIAVVVGLPLGLELPDIDQRIGFLLHRSIITHGPLLPIILFAWVSSSQSLPRRWFAMSVSLGLAVHFSFDLFPQAWSGYALIALPGLGWTPAPFSWIWLALNVLICTYLAAKLVRSGLETGLLGLGLIGGFIYAARTENALWGPIAAVMAATAVAAILALRRDRSTA